MAAPTAQDDTTRSQLSRLQEELAELKGQIAAYRGQIRERAAEYGHAARERAEHATEAARSQVHQRPLTSIATAFAVGLIVGALIGRR